MTTDENIKKANKFYDNAEYKKAIKYIEKILQQDSHNLAALILKGNILFQQQQFIDSLSYYQKALEQDSLYLPAIINTANAYFELHNYQQSYSLSKQYLNHKKDDISALTICGNSALELEKYSEAETCFQQLLKLDSQDAWCCNSLSQIYQKLSRYNDALEYGWKAVELSQGNEQQHINFGYLLYEIAMQDSSANIDSYARQWQQKYGSNFIVSHMANAILHNQKITRANDIYVQKIFDEFASDFDEVLASLNYQAPQLIASELHSIYGQLKHPNLRILDAGCGTGLCGVYLKKYATIFGLYGVDISQKMLDKAKQKKLYNKLICADLETYLFRQRNVFDLIVSADVFTYLGDLQKVLLGCYNSLQKNGRIIFTVSQNNVDDSDYYLHSSGRFLHHKNYLQNLLQKLHFEIEKMSPQILRNEGENKVQGYLISARKKA